MKKNNLNTIIFIILAMVIGYGAYIMAVKNTQITKPAIDNSAQINQQITNTPESIPTKTPEEIEKISKMKEYAIMISNNTFNPSELKVNTLDQVIWENKDNVAHQITGEDWGGVRIEPEEKFLQSFKNPGTYSYACSLHPEMKGMIIVE